MSATVYIINILVFDRSMHPSARLARLCKFAHPMRANCAMPTHKYKQIFGTVLVRHKVNHF